ncbi:heavy-metal-associated domain-containing protein [Chitinivorax sp. PXF-14]|uniref:heavy-metal-associated domain-containing protein n=1 Tax=Chitinivorax sp. PXF-14 TaxID=3230488 RepID=UPI0034658B56
MNELQMKVSGMSCGGCVSSVTKALKAVPGVSEVEVELASGAVHVTFDASQAGAEALRQAVEDAGYDVA